MLLSLPWSPSSMFLNNDRFSFDRIAMILHIITQLNPSSSENFLLTINYLNHLEMSLGESSLEYMSRVRGVSQRLQGILIDWIIPPFAIVSLYHNRYLGIKRHYLAEDPALVNCKLLGIGGMLSSKETRQQTLGLPMKYQESRRKRHPTSQPHPIRKIEIKHVPDHPLTQALPQIAPCQWGYLVNKPQQRSVQTAPVPGVTWTKPMSCQD